MLLMAISAVAVPCLPSVEVRKSRLSISSHFVGMMLTALWFRCAHRAA